MRLLCAWLAALAALVLIACGGDSGDSSPATTRPAATRTAALATKPPTTSPAGTASPTVEVTGIVGSVSTQTRTIEITRLSGADVRRLDLDDRTVIRRADGARGTLAEIRPSDRIIARGTLAASAGAMAATEITVQQTIGGGGPGG